MASQRQPDSFEGPWTICLGCAESIAPDDEGACLCDFKGREKRHVEVVPKALLDQETARAARLEQERDGYVVGKLRERDHAREAEAERDALQARLEEVREQLEAIWPTLRDPQHPRHEPAPTAGRRLRQLAEGLAATSDTEQGAG